MSAVAVVGLWLWSVPEPPEQYGDPGAACAAADPVAWFADHVDPATLTYEKFLRYSPAERAVVTRRVNEDLHSMLRREHLARAAQDDRFSSEQKGGDRARRGLARAARDGSRSICGAGP